MPHPLALTALRATTVLLVILAFGTTYQPARADNHIIYVNDDAAGANDGTSWADAYLDLQSALAVAQAGNEIWVAAGTYKPGTLANSTFQLKRGVKIYGGYAADESDPTLRNAGIYLTTLSGALTPTPAFHVVLANDVDRSALLDGFTITAGEALGRSQFPCFEQCGGGLYMNNGSPTLANVQFVANAGTYGGGMYVYNDSNPLLTNVLFFENRATGNGGGIQIDTSAPVLKDVSFLKNRAEFHGGGMLNNIASPILLNVYFEENRSGERGGAIANLAGSAPAIYDAIFLGNVALSMGGAIYNNGSSPTVNNAVMSGNVATARGGSLFHVGGSSGIWSHVTISCSTGARANDHITVEDNSTLSIRNSIIWTDDNKTFPIIWQSGTKVTIAYSLIFNSGGSGAAWDNALGVDGGGNLNGATSPFVSDCDDGGDGFGNASGNDYGNLSPALGAPAIDAGNNDLIPADEQDIDGDTDTAEAIPLDVRHLPRLVAITKLPAVVDMGAFERENGVPVAKMNGPHQLNEGSSIDLDASTATDDIGIDEYAWDCTNDGNYEVVALSPTGASCTYPDDGSFILRLTITDTAGATGITTTAVTVNNVAPQWTAPPNQSSLAGIAKTFDLGSFTDPGKDAPWMVTVDWGDASVTAPFFTDAPGDLTYGYAYLSVGTYNIVVRLHDGMEEVEGGFQVVVNPAPPGAPDLATVSAQSATVGEAKSFVLGSFTDVGDSAPWQVTVDWGDKSSSSQFIANAPGVLPNQSHIYSAPGVYVVLVTVSDGELTGSVTFQVTVVATPTVAEQIYIPAVTR